MKVKALYSETCTRVDNKQERKIRSNESTLIFRYILVYSTIAYVVYSKGGCQQERIENPICFAS